MIQGATLDAAFADLQDVGFTVSATAQVAAYVCLSRVKQLKHICILQPFSPLLFSRGPPVGPERLIRKLPQQTSREDAFSEWQSEWVENEVEEETNNPMTSKHLFTSCYLQGKQNYMLAASQFGVKKASDFHRMYVAQGRWTRCLQCQQNSGVHLPHAPQPQMSSNTRENPAHNQLICGVCNEKTN